MSTAKVRVLGSAMLSVLCLVVTPGLWGASPQLSSASSSTGVGVATVGLGGWEVQSSAIATQSGSAISTPGFSTAGFMHVTPDDAGAPGTEIEALLQNGACPNVFFSTNMENCFGYMGAIGPDTIAQFDVPWW